MTLINKYKSHLAWIGLVIILCLIRMPHAHATDFFLPDQDAITNPGGQPPPNSYVDVEIAQQGSIIHLDTPETWIKVIYDPGEPNNSVQIYDGDFSGCAVNTNDTQDNNGACTDPTAVTYNFFCADVTNQGQSPSNFITTTRSDALPNNSWATVTVSSAPCAPVDTGRGIKQIVFVQAVWNDAPPPGGRINGFQVAAVWPSGKASYWGDPRNQGGGFPGGVGSYAIQDRGHPEFTEENMDFAFAPSCSFTDGYPAELKWRDADAVNNGGNPKDGGQFSGDQHINFDLYENGVHIIHIDENGYTTYNGEPRVYVADENGNVANNIGGNGAYREVQFIAHKTARYDWWWNGVNRDNGIQMWAPFDSANATLGPCDSPPNPPTASGDCTNYGTLNLQNVTDPDWGGSLNVQIFYDGNLFKTVSGHGNFSVPVNEIADLNPHDFFARVISKDKSGNDHPEHTKDTNHVSIGGCAKAQCQPVSYDPSPPEDRNTAITFAMIINGLGPQAAPIQQGAYNFSAILTNATTGANSSSGNIAPWDPPGKAPPGNRVSATWHVNSLAGKYTLVWTFSGPSNPQQLPMKCNTAGQSGPGPNQPPPPSPPITVYTKPYFKAFEGDVITGPLSATCSPNWGASLGTGGLYGLNENNSGNIGPSRGAGTEAAAIALAQIAEFASANARTTSPAQPNGLAFASPPGPGWGGNFANNSKEYCPIDYFANPPAGIDPSAANHIKLQNWSGVQKFYVNHNVTIDPSYGDPNGIPANAKIYLYVNGDVSISGDSSSYAGIIANWDSPVTRTWHINSIPSITIIANNIYIQPNVQEIAATLIAKNTIYTCTDPANGFRAPRPTSPGHIPDMAAAGAACSKNWLRVFGSFIAPNIKFLRTRGSADQDSGAEDYGNTRAAEFFVFTPEDWLTNSGVPPTSSRSDYDSITSLPPVL
jgi:hypothetical protein